MIKSQQCLQFCCSVWILDYPFNENIKEVQQCSKNDSLIVLFHLQAEEVMVSVKKEEPEEKTESMEVEEKKPEMKTEPKEEDDAGANGTTSSSPSQSRRKSEFILKG